MLKRTILKYVSGFMCNAFSPKPKNSGIITINNGGIYEVTGSFKISDWSFTPAYSIAQATTQHTA